MSDKPPTTNHLRQDAVALRRLCGEILDSVVWNDPFEVIADKLARMCKPDELRSAMIQHLNETIWPPQALYWWTHMDPIDKILCCLVALKKARVG